MKSNKSKKKNIVKNEIKVRSLKSLTWKVIVSSGSRLGKSSLDPSNIFAWPVTSRSE